MSEIHPAWLIIGSFFLAGIPIFIGLGTTFLKVSIVVGMLRNGLGIQHAPSGVVVMSISLALTLFIMGPVLEETHNIAKGVDWSFIRKPPDSKNILKLGVLIEPWKKFMQSHSGRREKLALSLLSEKKQNKEFSQVQTNEEIADSERLRILIPAFMLSELKQAFSIGFTILIPFLVVDLVVSNILVGLGMYMVSPIMISLPIKLLLFVSADGWLVLSRALIRSYG